MGLLLGFLPFAAFALGERLLSTLGALTLATVVALALLGQGLLSRKSLKWLDVGASVIFGSLAIYTFVAGASWSVVGVRLASDTGLFALVALSLLVGRPFTLQYARERVAPELWDKPSFLRTNRRLTAVWCAVFAAMALADVAMLEGLPTTAGVAVTLLALGTGFFFTKRVQR